MTIKMSFVSGTNLALAACSSSSGSGAPTADSGGSVSISHSSSGSDASGLGWEGGSEREAADDAGANSGDGASTPEAGGSGDASAVGASPQNHASVISVGTFSSCAVTTSGSVECWGASNYLGGGAFDQELVPTPVGGLTTPVTAVSVGDDSTCAITAGGAVECWGWNNLGQLGDGTTADTLVPVQVTGLSSGVMALSVGPRSLGSSFACAVTTGGGVVCWGDNSRGQLGNGTTTSSSVPVQVTGLSSGVASVSVGVLSSCALTTAGAVLCWGSDDYGRLGPSVHGHDSSVPVAIEGLSSGVTAISVGDLSTCAITAGGGVECWGSNQYDTLGSGYDGHSLVPGPGTGLTSGVTAISVGADLVAALSAGGTVVWWGTDDFLPVQLPSTSPMSGVPEPVIGLPSGAKAVAVATDHACVITAAGGIACWGKNDTGELGNNSRTSSDVPVEVTGF